jgi:large subunit ribosomal protein L24
MERKKNKQPKLHLKAGDNVLIIAGERKGKQGKVISVDFEKLRAIVEEHVKPSASNPQGSIVEKEAGIHISNLMVIDPQTTKPARTGRRRDEKGKLQRFFKKPSKREL